MLGQFELSSIGFLAQQLQAPVSRIMDAAGRLGIQPNRLNGVPYFSAADVELIRGELIAELRSRESHIIDQRSGIS